MKIIEFTDLPKDKQSEFKSVSARGIENKYKQMGFTKPQPCEIEDRLSMDINRHVFVDINGKYFCFIPHKL